MAKHGKKKIRFHFEDLKFATFFLDFIRRKKFYSRVTGNMKHTGQLEFSIVGSSENVKIGIHKIKKLFNKAYETYMKDQQVVERFYNEIDDKEFDTDLIDDEEESKLNIKLNLKNLKFDV